MNGEFIINSSLVFIAFLFIGGTFYSIVSGLQFSKRKKVIAELHQKLAVGNEIMFSGGLTGTITQLDEEFCRVKLADKLDIKVSRYAITQIL
ncbi:preprotein translocase subunit YajC [Lactococcus garvieae]|uniref:preprotein translocase subunit YajC n=1 Tax=Lactococcus garvieae TaxID=1363 RepID=UPI0002F4A626|nr:preprotein translocase subunit YajC [Lactococcus garvieae]QPS70295.1 preprotein translocase subunit YajC [Lactococcus garvieae]